MSPWLMFVLVLLAGGLVLAAVFYWTARRRDLVRRPVEKQVGYGARKVLLIYQPSNRGRNHAIAWALARALAKAAIPSPSTTPPRCSATIPRAMTCSSLAAAFTWARWDGR